VRRGVWTEPEAAAGGSSLFPVSSRRRKNCYFATLSDRRGRQFRCFHRVRQIGIGHVDGWMQRAFFLCCGAVLPPKKGVCSAAGPVQSGFCIPKIPRKFLATGIYTDAILLSITPIPVPFAAVVPRPHRRSLADANCRPCVVRLC
jgi:hypothetical protein